MPETILIADDDRHMIDTLSLRCQAMGFHVVSATNAIDALLQAEQTTPSIVILDVNMPQGNGLSVCEMMSNHVKLRRLPVIMLTGSSSEETIRRCHELCAYYVPKCPNVWDRIEPILRELTFSQSISTTESNPQPPPIAQQTTIQPGPAIGVIDAVFSMLGVEEGDSLNLDDSMEPETRTDSPWVLSIEDDDDFALGLEIRLREFGLQVIRAASGTDGYRQAFLEAPRAIILDYELPQGNGDFVLRRLKESPATSEIPVIVLTGLKKPSVERQMRALGASEFLNKPIQWQRLREALNIQLDANAI